MDKVLREVAEQRSGEVVAVEFGRGGRPLYWVWGVTGKQAISRAVFEQMKREGAKVIKL